MLDRYRGALLGLAAGDALGTTLEFRATGTFKPIDDMHGGGPLNLRRGEWTNDTSMALCLAESLIECREFDPVDQLARYVRWQREGHHTAMARASTLAELSAPRSGGLSVTASRGPSAPMSPRQEVGR